MVNSEENRTTHTVIHVTDQDDRSVSDTVSRVFAHQSPSSQDDNGFNQDHLTTHVPQPQYRGFSVLDTGLWQEPVNDEMANRVTFFNLKAGDRVLMVPPAENEKSSEMVAGMHSIVLCQRGSLRSAMGSRLTNYDIGYNAPGNNIDLHAEEDSSLIVIDLARAVHGVPDSSRLEGDFQIRALDDLGWIDRLGKEAGICYLSEEFGFSRDYDADTTFHKPYAGEYKSINSKHQRDRIKLLDFAEGTELKAHMHPTTQFKALLSGHIAYQDKEEKQQKQHLYGGDLASVEHHTTYKGETEKSYMLLLDFTLRQRINALLCFGSVLYPSPLEVH